MNASEELAAEAVIVNARVITERLQGMVEVLDALTDELMRNRQGGGEADDG